MYKFKNKIVHLKTEDLFYTDKWKWDDFFFYDTKLWVRIFVCVF